MAGIAAFVRDWFREPPPTFELRAPSARWGQAKPRQARHALRVAEVIRETRSTCTFVLESPEGGAPRFDYRAGQHLTLLVDVGGTTHRRCYSFSSSPLTARLPAITVRRMADGVVSRHLHDRVHAGDTVLALDPTGNFTLETDAAASRHMVLVAGGVGITPLISLAETVLRAEPASRVTLLCGNRSEEEIVFRRRLAALEDECRPRLVVPHALDVTPENWAGLRGTLDGQQVLRALGGQRADGYFVCGPEAMLQSVLARALEESLSNAVYHGNLELSTEELKRLNNQNPHPGDGKKVDNIKLARQQQEQAKAYLKNARERVQPISPIPATAGGVDLKWGSPEGWTNLTRAEFGSALRLTIAQLQREASNHSVAIPANYGFSFEAQRQRTFEVGNLSGLAQQLGEVKAICGVLNAAKINSLVSLRRERVSTEDNAGPLSDYLSVNSETNELAVLTPYEITFYSFSAELAAVGAGFANSSHAMLGKGRQCEARAGGRDRSNTATRGGPESGLRDANTSNAAEPDAAARGDEFARGIQPPLRPRGRFRVSDRRTSL